MIIPHFISTKSSTIIVNTITFLDVCILLLLFWQVYYYNMFTPSIKQVPQHQSAPCSTFFQHKFTNHTKYKNLGFWYRMFLIFEIQFSCCITVEDCWYMFCLISCVMPITTIFEKVNYYWLLNPKILKFPYQYDSLIWKCDCCYNLYHLQPHRGGIFYRLNLDAHLYYLKWGIK